MFYKEDIVSVDTLSQSECSSRGSEETASRHSFMWLNTWLGWTLTQVPLWQPQGSCQGYHLLQGRLLKPVQCVLGVSCPQSLLVSPPPHQQSAFFLSSLFLFRGRGPSVTGPFQAGQEWTCPLLMALSYPFRSLCFTLFFLIVSKGFQTISKTC